MTENPKHSEEEKSSAPDLDNQVEEEQQQDEPSGQGEQDSAKELSPEEKISNLEEQLAQAQNQYLRSLAELENYRKRGSRERGEQLRFSAGDTLRGLFPILDNFRMGLQAAEQEGADSVVYQGMSMVRKQMEEYLAEQGIEELSPEGEAFDPLLHEALSKEVNLEVAEGTILTVLRRGYRLHDRVLRAPQVVVAASEAVQSGEEQQEEE